MRNYAAAALRTDKTLRRNGQLLKLTLKQKGTSTGGSVPITTVEKLAWGIETGVTTQDLGVGTVNGTLIKAGDRKILMSSLDDAGTALPELKIDDLVLAGGVKYSIKNVDKVAPAGVVVMWQLVARIG